MATADEKCASSNKIKVCPKCGKTHVVVASMFGTGFYVLCSGCHIETPTARSKEEALKLWNQGVFEGPFPVS